MKAKNITIAVLIGIGILLLWLFLSERKRAEMLDEMNHQLRKENEQLKEGYLSLFIKLLATESSKNSELIEELKKLKDSIDSLETSVHIELDAVISLVQSGHYEKAIKDLAKIVETQLKEKALKSEKFKHKPTLHNLLNYAKECNWINERMFQNSQLMREVRNTESHELAVKQPFHTIGLCIFAGIEIIYSISNNK